tara:strand:+ start:648 stop:1433 length:786 start_codon:yes stop_codon:yes gene_type:complete
MLLETQTLSNQLLEKSWQVLAVTHRDTFERVHIPGAIWIDPNILFGDSLYPSSEQIAAQLDACGVSSTIPTLIYDDGQGFLAGRLYWTLAWLGHSQLAYLDGGMVKWLKEERPFQDGPTKPTLCSNQWHFKPNLMIDGSTLHRQLGAYQVWDTRSYEEYTGSFRNAIQAGHIPGAIHFEWSEFLNPQTDTLHPLSTLPGRLEHVGIDINKPTVVYCQAHVRSAFAFMIGQLLGFKTLIGYVGGWQEWGNDCQFPIECSKTN